MTNIKKCRISCGMSQKQVAISLGVSSPTVSEWESGVKNPTFENAKKLAQLFGVSVDYLYGVEQQDSTQEAPTDDDIKFALFGGLDGVTDAMYEEVKSFAAFVREREKKKE